MESLNLLSELQKVPAAQDGATLSHDEAMARIRAMDSAHFAMEVSQGAEEALEALFQARNVRDDLVTDLREAHRLAFSNAAEDGRSVHEHYSDMVSRGAQSAEGFVSNLKGKVAELKAKDLLKEELPGSDVQLASSPTQQGWDLLLRLQDGQALRFQVKVGAETYAGDVAEAMQAHPGYRFLVSSEIYDRIVQSHPELIGRLRDLGPAAELTESVKDGLGTLAGNFGVDVPVSIGEALPYVGEVVLGLKLLWNMVRTERELAEIDITDRARIHGIRTLALASRFGINQVCMWTGSAGGTAVGSIAPAVGSVAGGLGGALVGIGGGMALNRLLQPRIEDVVMRLVGGDADDVFYLMNKVEIDRIGDSLVATQVA